MRVYLVNRFFWPDESATSLLLTDLAEDLKNAGHEVHVITSRQLYNQPKAQLPKEQIWQGVIIHRLRTSCLGRHNFAGRLCDILSFHLVLRYTHVITKRPDAWFIMTDPPLLVNTVLKLRQKLGGRIIHHIDDLYPDVAIALRTIPQQDWIASLLDHYVKWGLEKTDYNLALGECMAGVLQAKGIKKDRLDITPPWADGKKLFPLAHEQNKFREELRIPQEDVVVMYSGNMGLGHRFETILKAARDLAASDDIHFIFIGDGAKKSQINDYCHSYKLRNTVLLPHQPKERLRETLSAGDIHLISLDKNVQGFIVPSKLAGILAVGRPVIFLGNNQNSVAAAILQEQCGYIIPEGDFEQLAAVILRLKRDPCHRLRLGESARNLFIRKYDRAVVVPKIIFNIENSDKNLSK